MIIGWWMAVSLALAVPRPLTVAPGQPALVFGLPAINEEEAKASVNKAHISLSDYTGMLPLQPRKAVILHFFDRNAGTVELKVLSRLQRRYASRGVQVLGISGDAGERSTLAEWIEPLRLGFPVLRDNHRVVMGRYGITELPLTVVVDGDGHIFAIGQPMGADAEAAIDAELQSLIKR